MQPPNRHAVVNAIKEFLIIVTGVLTALALENWNSDRVERKNEGEYITAMRDDLRAHIARFDEWTAGLAEHRDWSKEIWSWANGTTPNRPVAQVLLSIRLGGQLDLNTQFQDAAYQDLLNSGRLGLIKQRRVREALVDYHNRLDRWIPVIQENHAVARERYAGAVVGVVPAEVAWRAAMREDLSSVDLAPILSNFRERPAIRDALVGMVQSFDFRMNAANTNREAAQSLLAVLDSVALR